MSDSEKREFTGREGVDFDGHRLIPRDDELGEFMPANVTRGIITDYGAAERRKFKRRHDDLTPELSATTNWCGSDCTCRGQKVIE